MYKTVIISFVLIFISIYSFPQQADPSRVNRIFNGAVKMYSDGNYTGALEIFERISRNYPYNSKTTASIIFRAKCLIELRKFSEAENILKDFLKKYSRSKFVDEARLTLAKAYIGRNQYTKSVIELINVYSVSHSDEYISESKEVIENLVLQYLTTAELRSVLDSAEDNKVKPFLLLLLGKLYIDNGMKAYAREIFSDLVKLYPDSEERQLAELYSSDEGTVPKTSVEKLTLMGLMLPLSGIENSDAINASKEILEGVRYAVAEFNEGREDKVGLVVMDTENSREKIAKIKEQVAPDASIKVILGPVFSSEVGVALEEFKNSDIPIVSPTATDNDLTFINDNFFQANPNFIVRAKAMAQYVYYVENKRRMAVLNSIDGYSPLLAAEFIKEFEYLGGVIVVKSTYRGSMLSSGNQLSEFSSKLDDSEGIYLPLAERIDAPLLLSQLVQNEIDLPLYGNQDWFLAKGYETSPELSNKMTFTSDYFIDYNNSSFESFNKKFIFRTRIDANRNALYGYDAAKYILTVIRNIDPQRRNIKMKMESGISVIGYHNNIAFDKNRVNRFINIVKYNNGFFELVDKFKANI
jgi:branched-chain amino acid transport system substrate-binding protein